MSHLPMVMVLSRLQLWMGGHGCDRHDHLLVVMMVLLQRGHRNKRVRNIHNWPAPDTGNGEAPESSQTNGRWPDQRQPNPHHPWRQHLLHHRFFPCLPLLFFFFFCLLFWFFFFFFLLSPFLVLLPCISVLPTLLFFSWLRHSAPPLFFFFLPPFSSFFSSKPASPPTRFFFGPFLSGSRFSLLLLLIRPLFPSSSRIFFGPPFFATLPSFCSLSASPSLFFLSFFLLYAFSFLTFRHLKTWKWDVGDPMSPTIIFFSFIFLIFFYFVIFFLTFFFHFFLFFYFFYFFIIFLMFCSKFKKNNKIRIK